MDNELEVLMDDFLAASYMTPPKDLYYILNPDKSVAAVDVKTWGEWFESNTDQRRVGLDTIGPLMLSTVFLGLNHNFSDKGEPVLFEMMMFGPETAEDGSVDMNAEMGCARFTTYEEALAAHNFMKEKLRELVVKGLSDESRE